MRREPLAYFLGLRARYGGFVTMRLGPIRYVAVAEPELVRRVLVDDAPGYKKGMALERARVVLGDGLLTSEGELHRRQARLAAPAFGRRRILGYAPTISRLAGETSDGWSDGGELDVAAEMTRLTLRVVVSTLFGATVDVKEADRVGRALTDVLEDFEWLVAHPLGRMRERLPTPRIRRFRAARDVIDATVDRLLAERRAGGGGGDDLLSVLVDARDGAGAQMSGALLRDEALTLLIAGHETTANWLTFAWLALSDHPEVEGRLAGELEHGLTGRDVALEEAEGLPYLRAVLEETLRLYPPAWGIGRRALRDGDLAGHRVPKGAVISICQYTMHHDAALWDDPERFDPERWLDGRAAAVPRGGYFPFSDGPRRCIAEHFARAEALLVIATLARRWRLVRSEHEPVVLDAKVTLRPRGGLRMTARRRPVREVASAEG